MKALCAALVLGGLLGQAKEDKDLAAKLELGVSIRKPPKNDEWAFREHGFFANSALVVGHKVDEITIEVFEQNKLANGYFNLKELPNNEFKNVSGFNGVTEPKKISTGNQKLPGGGGGNVQTNYLEMTFKKEGKPMELRMWAFVGRNQNAYRVYLTCEEGMYRKHQRIADYILSTVETFKPK